MPSGVIQYFPAEADGEDEHARRVLAYAAQVAGASPAHIAAASRVKPSSRRCKPKPLNVLDPVTGKVVRRFKSGKAAARWLQQHGHPGARAGGLVTAMKAGWKSSGFKWFRPAA